jgi:hypothetical protein
LNNDGKKSEEKSEKSDVDYALVKEEERTKKK